MRERCYGERVWRKEGSFKKKFFSIYEQDLIEEAETQLQEETDRCVNDLSTLRNENKEVQENCRLAAAINSQHTIQMTEKEEHICQLLGEVEVLRARKSVVLRWMCELSDGR